MSLDIETIREMKWQLVSREVMPGQPFYAQVTLGCIREQFADTSQEIIEATKDLDPSTVVVISGGGWSVLTDEDGCVLGFK
jgi:hypothetical protein